MSTTNETVPNRLRRTHTYAVLRRICLVALTCLTIPAAGWMLYLGVSGYYRVWLEIRTIDAIFQTTGVQQYLHAGTTVLGIGLVAVSIMLLERTFAVKTEVRQAQDMLDIELMLREIVIERFPDSKIILQQAKSFPELLSQVEQRGIEISDTVIQIAAKLDAAMETLADSELQEQYDQLRGFVATIRRVANRKLDQLDEAEKELSNLLVLDRRLSETEASIAAAKERHKSLIAANPDIVELKRS